MLIVKMNSILIYFLAFFISSYSNGNKSVIKRLPRDLLPYHYNLTLKPIFHSLPPFTFWGQVHIYFECFHNTSLLILNGNDLPNPSSIKISLSNDNTLPQPTPVIESIKAIKSKSFLVFQMKSNFVVGAKYVFKAQFSGEILGDINGLFWKNYLDFNNVTKYVATTQLQPTYARKVFPCFDEIDMKATFNISVIRPSSGYIALSNMPKINSLQLSDGWTEDYFDTTPKMSIYLVCIAVGDFKEVPAVSAPGMHINMSLYAIEPQKNNLEFIANHVGKLQKWFHDNIFHPFMEKKIDHIAIPKMLSAMENWGLVTYGQEKICITNDTTSVYEQLIAATVVSHELAHMRFGNLVTCEWWDELWLHEGITTHLNFESLESLGWDGFQAQQASSLKGLQNVMAYDQKNTSNIIRKFISEPDRALLSFNRMIYDKGAAIIRHLRGILTRPIFFAALERFLRLNEYQNVCTKNFTDALDEQAKIDGITYPNQEPLNFHTILDPWLNQIGFPLITVTRINDSFVKASQMIYLHPRNQTLTETSYNHSWEIPLNLVGEKSDFADWSRPPTNWIQINETSTTMEIASVGDWYILNPRQHFFYRVLYDEINRRQLIDQLLTNHTAILTETRSQLIDDTFDLARNSYLDITEALRLTQYLGSEEEYSPWEAALKHLKFIAPFFEREPFYAKFKKHIMSKLDILLDNIGYEFPENETILRSLLRKEAIAAACSLGSRSVDANVLPTVLCRGVIEGSYRDWKTIYNQFVVRRSSHIKNERQAYIYALICTKNTTLLDRIHNIILEGTFFGKTDSPIASQYLITSIYGVNKTWEHFKTTNSIEYVVFNFKLMKALTERWYTDEHIEELENFLSSKSQKLGQYAQFVPGLLQVKLNREFYKNNVDLLEHWINANVNEVSYKCRRSHLKL